MTTSHPMSYLPDPVWKMKGLHAQHLRWYPHVKSQEDQYLYCNINMKLPVMKGSRTLMMKWHDIAFCNNQDADHCDRTSWRYAVGKILGELGLTLALALHMTALVQCTLIQLWMFSYWFLSRIPRKTSLYFLKMNMQV